jgi:hypothetical protein
MSSESLSAFRYDVIRCGGCERVFEARDAVTGRFDDDEEWVEFDEPRCARCGTPITHEDTRSMTVDFRDAYSVDEHKDIERFVEHPDPDRFFQQIEPAEIETRVMDHDDVTFKSQFVPGGKFGVELSARYTYAGRECTQTITLDRDATESLYKRLDRVLESDRR